MASSEASSSSSPGFSELPELVRRRILELAAQVLPNVSPLPAALKRVADFAPQRRARAGAGAIATALGDDDIRSRIGHQVAAIAGDHTGPSEVAAGLWLCRPDRWQADLEATLATVTGQSAAVEHEAAQLRHRLASAEQQLERQRTEHEAVATDLRAEVKLLRDRLGKARAEGREQRGATERVAELTALLAQRDAEIEQLQQRTRDAEATAAKLAQDLAATDPRQAAGTERADRRAARVEGTVRARMLLDVLVEASTGLRRELGLPTSETAPADRVEAELALATPSEPQGPTPTTRADLEALLSMPKARLIIDGYNVSQLTWPSLSLEAQRTRLVQGLASLVARTGVDTVVVFDAYAAPARPVRGGPRGIKVFFSAAGELADDAIRKLVAAEPPGRPIVVATNDREVIEAVQRDGARVVASEHLADVL